MSIDRERVEMYLSESKRKLVPYTGTNGDPDTFYCQIDEVELWGSRDLLDHANELVLFLQSQLLQAKKELELNKSWVKHHQKSVENAMSERNEYKKELDKASELLREAVEFLIVTRDHFREDCVGRDTSVLILDNFLNKPEIKKLRGDK
jgi:hypothetical protein